MVAGSTKRAVTRQIVVQNQFRKIVDPVEFVQADEVAPHNITQGTVEAFHSTGRSFVTSSIYVSRNAIG